MTCLVCGSRESEPHFGGMSCRACAAFFRRYFNSKKFIIRCSCKTKSENSHPCRSCRVAKCIAVGMTPEKLCGQRDPNGTSIRTLDQRKWSSTMVSNSSCMPIMPYLPPKDVTNITSTLLNFSIFEAKRIQMFQNLGLQNVFAITSLTKHDLNLTSELVGEVFPDFQKLSNYDKNSLVSSFFLKLRQIQPALDHVAQRVEYQRMEEEDVRIRMMEFFEGSFLDGQEMQQEDIWRIFGPHWTYFFERVIEPIIALQLDQIEFMAIVWILFFDPAYINMSQKGADLCWTIRKVIHRELKNYIFEKIDNSEIAENRFLEILQVPLIVEHGEQKFLDEFIICELNRIRIHDDFKAIVRKQRI